tara:strand:- start:769 stop:1956 length:1188 start_codon:yes stop_codon:yes gene_type:complete
MKINYLILFLTVFSFIHSNSFAQEKIIIEGSVVDEYEMEVPYAAVGIIKKNIGVTSTEDGTFSFFVSINELNDILEISSIGFETFKIKIKDFIYGDKHIVLKEKVSVLEGVVVSAPINNVKLAFKLMKENFINSSHQLDILYRRWDVEENICRYFIEHYLTVLEKGPPSMLRRYSIKESRNSADYRYVKNNAKTHPIENTVWMNPLRNGASIRSMKWKKIDVSTYDDEDIIIYEGTGDNETIKLFIGFETNKIYRAERSWKPPVGKSQSGIWIYKKNSIGKLYLSYHQREWIGARRLPQNVKNMLSSNGKKVPEFVPVEFRHELFVVGIKENKKDFNKFNETLEKKDMSLYKIPYDDFFWKNFSLPPETNYFKNNKSELESIYKVSLETQFKFSN